MDYDELGNGALSEWTSPYPAPIPHPDAPSGGDIAHGDPPDAPKPRRHLNNGNGHGGGNGVGPGGNQGGPPGPPAGPPGNPPGNGPPGP